MDWVMNALVVIFLAPLSLFLGCMLLMGLGLVLELLTSKSRRIKEIEIPPVGQEEE